MYALHCRGVHEVHGQKYVYIFAWKRFWEYSYVRIATLELYLSTLPWLFFFGGGPWVCPGQAGNLALPWRKVADAILETFKHDFDIRDTTRVLGLEFRGCLWITLRLAATRNGRLSFLAFFSQLKVMMDVMFVFVFGLGLGVLSYGFVINRGI